MKVQQFNFARNWRRIEPHLYDEEVVVALELGLTTLNPHREVGDPPWLEGRGALNGQRAYFGKLSYYQPWGRCHYIAPFSWAIGKKLFPELRWGFLTSESHTVAVGLDEEDIVLVMDILLFKEVTAEESIAFVTGADWKLVFSVGEMICGDGASEETLAEQALFWAGLEEKSVAGASALASVEV